MNWFRDKKVVLKENEKLRQENADLKKQMCDMSYAYDKWRQEYYLEKENKELKEAIRLAEEDNSRLYMIIAELRKERNT